MIYLIQKLWHNLSFPILLFNFLFLFFHIFPLSIDYFNKYFAYRTTSFVATIFNIIHKKAKRDKSLLWIKYLHFQKNNKQTNHFIFVFKWLIWRFKFFKFSGIKNYNNGIFHICVESMCSSKESYTLKIRVDHSL